MVGGCPAHLSGAPGSGVSELPFTASTARVQRVTASLARSMMAFG